MKTRKTSNETPHRNGAEATRSAEDERPRESPKSSEPLDEKSLDEVMRDCPL